MPTLTFPISTMPCQIDVPADVERSVKGSLHVKPGTLLVTAGELKFLREKHPRVVSPMVAVVEDLAPLAKVEPKPEPKPTPRDAAMPMLADEHTPVPGDEPAPNKPKNKLK